MHDVAAAGQDGPGQRTVLQRAAPGQSQPVSVGVYTGMLLLSKV
jgi:hypothetical protein